MSVIESARNDSICGDEAGPATRVLLTETTNMPADIDPNEIVKAGAMAYASRDLIASIFGQSADYVGGELRNFIEKCNINIDQVIKNAAKKLGGRLDAPGSVDSRIVMEVLDRGRFCENELAAEYYGGILASSRCKTGDDDRNIALLSILSGMSSPQIRLHYIHYLLTTKLYKGSSLKIGIEGYKMGIFIPADEFYKAMAIPSESMFESITAHSVIGLNRLGLTGGNCSYGSFERARKRLPQAATSGVFLTPSVVGAELFMAAMGVSDPNGQMILQVGLDELESEIEISTESVLRESPE